MKKLFTIIVAILLTATVWAQAPQKMSYQAVIRNNVGVLVNNQMIGMEINIRQGSSTGTIVYTETQTPTTNANGLVSIEIGGGAGFSTINWASNTYYIETKTALVPPLTTYTITGVSQLLSVPYALYAASSTPTGTAGGDLTGTYPNPTIANNAVTNTKIANNAITTTKIADVNVTTPKIADNAVTIAKLPTGATASTFLRGDGIWANPTGGSGITGTGTANKLAFWTGTSALASNTNLHWNNTSERLGIGTSDPLTPLQVMSSFNMAGTVAGDVNGALSTLRLRTNSIVTGEMTGISFVVTNNEQWGTGGAISFERTGSNSIGKLHFATKGSTTLLHEIPIRMTIAETGNVGIGTLTPSRLLEVSGTGEQNIRVTNTGTDNVGIELLRTGTGAYDWKIANYAGNLRFYWSGDDLATTTDAMSINYSNGRVGIGTTTPTQQLDVAGNIRLRDANRSIGTWSSHEFALIANSVERLTIKTDGKVGIGTTTPSGLLTVDADGAGTGYPAIRANNSNAAGIALFASANSSDAAMVVTQSNTTSGIMAKFFNTGSYELVKIHTNGGTKGVVNLRGGNTAVGGGYVSGDNQWGLIMGYFGTDQMNLAVANAYGPTTGNKAFAPYTANNIDLGNTNYKWASVWATNGIIQTSDKNKKQNIQDISYGLDAVMQLKPVSFQWKDKNCSVGTGNNLGFIAQDIEKIIPDVVVHTLTSKEEMELARKEKGIELDPESYGVKYSELIPVMVKAMQEQQQMISDQNLSIAELKKLVEQQQKQIDQLLNK